jgi:hypothetical protein
MKDRTFIARNGELGIHLDDIETFLSACERDGAAVLCWEVWLADHQPDLPGSGFPTAAPGKWSGLIPVKKQTSTAVIGGSVLSGWKDTESWAEFARRSVSTARDQIADLKPDEEVSLEWLPFIRVNFTFKFENEH